MADTVWEGTAGCWPACASVALPTCGVAQQKKKKEEEQDPNISLTEVQIQNFQVIYSLTNALNKHLMSLLCSNNWPGKRRYHDGISQEPI